MRYLAVIALIIFAFANQGCLYDKPVPLATCDTTGIITYSGVVTPILTANCYRCHSRPNAPANANGIVLDDYTSLKKVVPQPLIDALQHTGTVVPMPKDGIMLDACTIEKIKKWIAQGALNN